MLKDWFKVRNLASPLNNAGEIAISGYIGQSNQPYYDYYDEVFRETGGAGTVNELRAAVAALGDVTEIVLRVTTEGGSLFDALCLGDILNRHPARIVAVIEGYALSAGSVLIAMCADEIQMSANAYQMMHNTTNDVYNGDASSMRAMADLLDKTSDNIASIYAKRGGGDAKKFRAMMDAETYLTGTECAALKLADVITDEVVLLNFARGPLAIKSAKPDRMPAALREVFDKPATSAANNENQNADDMKKEEIEALLATGIQNAVAPLTEKNTTLESSLATLRGEVPTMIENVAKPLRDENVALKSEVAGLTTTNAALKAEIAEVRALQAGGIIDASKGADPIRNAGPDGKEIQNASPRDRVKAALAERRK